MEQQTVSVAKAGIIASLNARTSVLASANPVGSRYNPRLSIIDNIHLPPSLISRFDLIYLVLDKPDSVTDRKLARHLISLYYEQQPPSSQARSPQFRPVIPDTIFLIYYYYYLFLNRLVLRIRHIAMGLCHRPRMPILCL